MIREEGNLFGKGVNESKQLEKVQALEYKVRRAKQDYEMAMRGDQALLF